MSAIKRDLIQFQKEFPLLIPNGNLTIWEGYLYPENPQLKIKVHAPHYPELKDFQLDCSPLLKSYLMAQARTLKSCKTLKGLIYSIVHVIKTKISSVNLNDPLWDSKTIKNTHELLCELEEVIAKKNIVMIAENFRDITVKYCDSEKNVHILRFLVPLDYPRGYISVLEADLPAEVLSSLSKISLIKTLYDMFQEKVESLLPFWNACKILEEKSWVIDPQNPQRRDIFRKIVLNDHLSVMLTLSPMEVSVCPDVKFLGSMNSVVEARAKFLRNIDAIGWNEDLDIADNISELLEIPRLPVRNLDPSQGEVTENECYICFAYIVDDEEPPSKWCTNKNCSSWYHYSCLIHWLETVVTSVHMFDHISGTCPYCDEKIWCPLRNDANK